MSYRLELDQRPEEAARRTLAGQLDKAVGRLDGPPDDRATALHDLRKDLKKSRSLLRLMRPSLADDLYRAEMTTLRESARAVSATRDADALPAALQGLRDRYVGRLPDSTYATLGDVLIRREAQEHDGLAGQRETLAGARERVGGWPLREIGWAQILDRLQDSYRRGRKAFGRARREPSVEALHEWRKRAKDLLYQVSLLEDAWPAVLGAYAQQAHRLADLLGDDHDLAMLVALLREPDGPAEQVSEPVEPVIELAEQRRLQLQHKAWRLGRRLYGESPKEFRQRIGQLVQAAQSHGRRPPSSLGQAA